MFARGPRLRGWAAALVLFALAGCAPEPGTVRLAEAAVETPEPIQIEVQRDPLREWVVEHVHAMTLREKLAGLLMLHHGGTDPAALRAFVNRWQPAGLILMGDNVPGSAEALRRLTGALNADSELPLLNAIDQEGGIVRRIPGDNAPGARQLRSMPAEASRDAFVSRSRLVASAGVAINFGIVADYTGNRNAFIWSRTLGDTPQAAAERVANAVQGERGNVLSTLKHFPGHGATPGDSHSQIPLTGVDYERWRETHAKPFESGIQAGAELVMFGHLRFSSVDSAPATLSARWHEVLRNELGFRGLTVTDDLSMLEYSGVAEYADPVENAVRALAAGNDLLLFVGSVDPAALVDGLSDAVESGRILESRVDDAITRVTWTRRELALADGSGEPSPDVQQIPD